MEYRYPHFRRDLLWEEGAFHGGVTSGQLFPDFDLPAADGGRVRKRDYVGRRPFLLVTSSITCPMTASAGPVLRQLHREFRGTIDFITLYVRESHPGEKHPQPGTMEQKIRNAREYANRDAIPWVIAVDDLEGSLHKQLDYKPNCVYLVNLDGKVASRVLWANQVKPLRTRLKMLATHRRSHDGQDEHRIVPMLRGVGKMQEVLAEAGEEAQHDMLRAQPTAYALGKLAGAFQPLPPLARTVAAVVTIAAGAAILAGISWRLIAGASKSPRRTVRDID